MNQAVNSIAFVGVFYAGADAPFSILSVRLPTSLVLRQGQTLPSPAHLAGNEFHPDPSTSPGSSRGKVATAEAAVLPCRRRWAPFRRRTWDTSGPGRWDQRGRARDRNCSAA